MRSFFCGLFVMLSGLGVNQAQAQIHDILPEENACPPCQQALPCPEPESGSRGQLEAGASLLILVPRFESNPAFAVNEIKIGGPGGTLRRERRVQEFDYDVSLSPRVWLQYELANKVGLRTRWFHFNQSAPSAMVTNRAISPTDTTVFRSISSTSPLLAIETSTTLPAVNSTQTPNLQAMDEVIVVTSDLIFDVWDVELIFSDVIFGAWELEMHGGLRYAHITQHYNAYSTGNLSQFIFSGQSFNGVGPMVGASGRRQLWPGLVVLGGARFAFLFGEDQHTVNGMNIGLVPPFTPIVHVDRSQRERILPVVEVEMGIEWARQLDGVEVFLQGGAQAQLWPIGSGANGNGNMGFVGAFLNTGGRF